MRFSVASLFIICFFGVGIVLAETQATPEQQAILRRFGITSNLADPSFFNLIQGGCDFDPYQVLETEFKGSPGTGITPRATSGPNDITAGLSPVLACRLAKFLRFAQSNGCPSKISYGFRSHGEQERLCGGKYGTGCLEPGQSCHQYGAAVDVTGPCVENGRLKQLSNANKDYRLVFPYSNNHIQCEEIPEGNCIRKQSCGGLNINPIKDATGLQQAQQSPAQNAMNAMRNMFTPPQPVQCPAGYVLLNGSCLPQQTMQTTNPFDYYTPPATTTASTSPVNINTNSNTNDTKPVTSAIDLINSIANPTSTSATSTTIGHSVSLNDSLKDVVSLDAKSSASGTVVTSTVALAPAVQQTFVSQDLSQTTMRPLGSRNMSTFALLENLRQILLSILQMLRPFGGTVPHPPAANNTATATLE